MGSPAGKKVAPICAAKRPKIRKSKSSTKLPTAHEMTARLRIWTYSADWMTPLDRIAPESDISPPRYAKKSGLAGMNVCLSDKILLESYFRVNRPRAFDLLKYWDGIAT